MSADLCLGTVQFGTQYGIQGNSRPNRQEAFEMLSYALAHGVCWFDTASAYGTAEELLGDYVREHPEQKENMRIVSKLALKDVPAQKRKDMLLLRIQDSLKRLRRQQIDGCLLHDAALVFDAEAIDALHCVRREGFAKAIGVSVYTPQEAMQALSDSRIDMIQVPYNVFDHRLDHCGFFEEAQKKNVQVFARSSLLQGLAVMRPEDLPKHMDFAGPFLSAFHRICENASISPLHAAIGYVAHHPGIQYLLFGVDRKQQLSEYLSYVSIPLPMETKRALDAAFEAVPEKLVNPSLWNR